MKCRQHGRTMPHAILDSMVYIVRHFAPFGGVAMVKVHFFGSLLLGISPGPHQTSNMCSSSTSPRPSLRFSFPKATVRGRAANRVRPPPPLSLALSPDGGSDGPTGRCRRVCSRVLREIVKRDDIPAPSVDECPGSPFGVRVSKQLNSRTLEGPGRDHRWTIGKAYTNHYHPLLLVMGDTQYTL